MLRLLFLGTLLLIGFSFSIPKFESESPFNHYRITNNSAVYCGPSSLSKGEVQKKLCELTQTEMTYADLDQMFYYIHILAGVNTTDCLTTYRSVGEEGPLKNMTLARERGMVRQWFDNQYGECICSALNLEKLMTGEKIEYVDFGGILINFYEFTNVAAFKALVKAYPNIDFTTYSDPTSNMTLVQYIEDTVEEFGEYEEDDCFLSIVKRDDPETIRKKCANVD